MDSSDRNAISEIRLKWYDDSTLFTEDPEELLWQFLKSLGITSKPAFEVFQVLLITHKAGVKISAKEVWTQVIAFRKKRGDSDKLGLTLRNIQVWLKYFVDIGLVENSQDKFMFRSAKKPSKCFTQYTVPIIEASTDYTKRLLEKMEKSFGV